MQTDGLADDAKKDALLGKTIRDPIDPRCDTSDSASSHSMSQRSGSSPSSQGGVCAPNLALPSHVGNKPQRAQHISGKLSVNILSPSNLTAHAKLPQIYSPQVRNSTSSPLSPKQNAKTKSLNSVQAALLLDSQLLGSPWSGGHPLPAGHPVSSPTRAGSGAGNAVVYSTYWNATSSPMPYPCGSPTAYSSATRIMSPSTQSLRQQQLQSNDDSSPVQLSISTFGHETSFIGAGASAFGSPSATGIAHSTILDAPLQAALVPPPYRDDYPFFSFGQSILQSAPFTPTIQTPTSRRHSIYHDTMLELLQHRQEQDNPLSLFQSENAQPTGHDCTPTSLAGGNGGGMSSTSNTPLTMEVADLMPHELQPRATSEASLASGTGVIVPPTFVDGALVDWTKLGCMLLPSPRLPEPLTARPHAHNHNVDDEVRGAASQKRGPTEEEADEANMSEVCVGDSNHSSCNSTPRTLPSNFGNTPALPNAIADNDVSQESQQLEELGRTKRPHETDSNNVTGPDEASDTETNNVAVVSLSDANLAYCEKHAKEAAAAAATTTACTTPLECASAGNVLQIATPQTNHWRWYTTQPSTPGLAQPPACLTGGVPDFHLFMPSPVDESSHGFVPLRDGLTRCSPLEYSTSTLSLVPNFGVRQASSALFSTWQSASVSPSTAPTVQAALDDLLEVLRLLQSDIDNVYGRVSISEHTVRHWASCVLNALLHLTVEILHSVRLSATEEENERASKEMAEAEAGQNDLKYAHLCAELQSGAKSCVETLRNTISAVKRDREILEPLLFTSMLARGSTISLLHTLEKTYLHTDNQPTGADAAATVSKQLDGYDTTAAGTNATKAATAVATATSTTTIPANWRIAPVVPIPAPITAARIEELTGSDLLAKELSGEWCQFTSDYNHKLLRYFFLRVLYAQLSGEDGHSNSVSIGNSASGDTGAAAFAAGVAAAIVDDTLQQGNPNSSSHSGRDNGNSSWTNALRTIESAWVDDQLKRWGAVFQHDTYNTDHKSAPKSGSAPHIDETTLEFLREVFCQDFPAFDIVLDMFSSFRERECWRCWYILLDQVMACTFHVQDKKELLEYVEKTFLEAPTLSASAALHAISAGRITLKEVEDALGRVETSLTAMEEQGKARRVIILQLLLRRIIALGVVSSVHRAFGKDAVVSDAQLATYVQVQRKSLEEVEAQLTAEHTEGIMHVKCFRAFLALFSNNASHTESKTSVAALDGVAEAHQLLPDTVTPSVLSPGSQWNTSTIKPFASLLACTRSLSGTTDRSDETADGNSIRSDDEAQKHARDAFSLVRGVFTRIMETINSLCTLLQSDVDVRGAKRGYSMSPTIMPVPSTRALRRLQASLTEAHRSVIVCLASLHSD